MSQNSLDVSPHPDPPQVLLTIFNPSFITFSTNFYSQRKMPQISLCIYPPSSPFPYNFDWNETILARNEASNTPFFYLFQYKTFSSAAHLSASLWCASFSADHLQCSYDKVVGQSRSQ